jgi:hypothetical protein
MGGVRVENKTLVLDFLEWLAKGPRPYADVMEQWRTSCPRFPIWEDSVGNGLVVCVRANGSAATVDITPEGLAFLRSERPVLR